MNVTPQNMFIYALFIDFRESHSCTFCRQIQSQFWQCQDKAHITHSLKHSTIKMRIYLGEERWADARRCKTRWVMGNSSRREAVAQGGKWQLKFEKSNPSGNLKRQGGNWKAAETIASSPSWWIYMCLCCTIILVILQGKSICFGASVNVSWWRIICL